jgi:hypothetical protein
MTRNVAAFALLLFGCSTGTEGAVSFRWRILDQCTGESFDPANNADSMTGACTHSNDNNTGWRVDSVQLGALNHDHVDACTPSLCVFPCKQREATTAFEIPAGIYSLSVAATLTTDGGTSVCLASTPPPLVRSVNSAEITNLDVIQIDVFTGCAAPAGCQ